MKFKILTLMSIALLTVTLLSILSPSQQVKALDYTWDNIRWAGNSAAYDDGALDATWRWELWQAKYTWSTAGSNFYFTQATNNSPYDLFIGETSVADAGAETQTSPHTWSSPYWIIGNTCYTVFNEDMSWSVGGGGGTLDIQTIALHEFGHWLRLEDLNGSGDTAKVMHKNYNGVKRSLHQGDISGLIAIYGAN